MKRLALVFTALLSFGGIAHAQNVAGAYVGATIGQSWGTGQWQFQGAGTSIDTGPDGWIGGVLAGLNWQSGSTVFGVEADVGSGPLSSETSCPNSIFNCKTEVKWLSTLRGRLGLVNQTAMIYVTGGAAAGDVKVSAHDNFALGVSDNASKTMVGWSAGAGIASPASQGLGWRVEWLHTDLGKVDVTLNQLASTQTVKYKTDMLRVGLEYRF